MIAVNSKFGLFIFGFINMRNIWYDNIIVLNFVIFGELFFDEAKEGDEIIDMLKKFWEIDSIGIIENIDSIS